MESGPEFFMPSVKVGDGLTFLQNPFPVRFQVVGVLIDQRHQRIKRVETAPVNRDQKRIANY